MFKSIAEEYRSTLKSSDTEENIDLCFYRPIGFAWAWLFRKLGVHPNVVTIASMFLGVGAAICFYYSNIWITLLGMFLLVWANSYDSADGQLARLTGQFSKLGRILDGAAGDVWFVSIYIAICLRTVRDVPFFHEHPWLIWVVAVLAGVWLTGQLMRITSGDAAASAAVLAKYWAGTFCLLGHMFPCFFQFRGGKGVLSGSAVALMIGIGGDGALPSWIVPVTVWVGFIVLVAATRYVSLGSCWGGASFIAASWIVYQDPLILLLF